MNPCSAVFNIGAFLIKMVWALIFFCFQFSSMQNTSIFGHSS